MVLFFFFLLYLLLNLIMGAMLLPLPVSDTGTVRYKSVPYMTIGLIILNSIIFMAWQAPDIYSIDPDAAETMTDAQYFAAIYPYIEKLWTFGYRATFMREAVGLGALTTFTSIFMHADLWHLFGNMIFLWTFGRRVEDACGPWRYLLFYLTAGMIANFGSAVLNPGTADLPGIGASGAISGVMGAYLIMFPTAKVSCLWILGSVLRVPVAAITERKMWTWTIQIPAWILLIYYVIKDAIPSFSVIQQGKEIGGVNNLAHLTGFLAALLIFLFMRKDLLMRYIAGRQM